MTTVFVILTLIVAGVIVVSLLEKQKVDAMSPEERSAYSERKQAARDTLAHGAVNAAMVCPHCQTTGKVRTKAVDRKKGISGGKATAAVLTGGVSVLATGLSRKEHLTRARCGNCGSAWDF